LGYSRAHDANPEIPMTLFSDLQAAYTKWQQARSDYRTLSLNFLRQFAEAFRKHIGAPEHYNVPEDDARKPYVELLMVSEDEEGHYRFSGSRSPFDLLSQEPDGFWLTGIGLVVDRSANVFPKAEFYYPIRFVLRGSNSEMIFPGGERFVFSTNAVDDQKQVFDYMLGIVKDILGTPPWETTARRSIGFVPPVE
jgi:hypothetical protein